MSDFKPVIYLVSALFLTTASPASADEPLALAALAPTDAAAADGAARQLDLGGLEIAAPKSGEKLNIGYEIHVGGFHLASINLVEVVDHDHYVAATQLSTKGLADAIDSSQVKALSTGNVQGRLVIPRTYNSDVVTDKRQLVGLLFDQGEPLSLDSNPPYDLKRYPVAPELKLNTVDPLSAALFVSLGSSVNDKEKCGTVVPIFDGKRRYNLTLKFLGDDQISLGRDGYNQGKPFPALMCRAHYKRVAGFKPPKPGHKATVWPPIDVWLAPIKDTSFLVPVRMQASTEFGAIVVRAVRLKVEPNGNPT
jgi:Protein of unknown function (DUF3108)